MKRILKMLAMALIAAPLALSSCSDDNTEPNPNPNPNPGPGGEVTEDEYGNTINSGENAYAPIRWAEGNYKTGDNGVSIEIKSTALKNIVFEVTPGSNIKAYKLDVYPLASIYSTMQNQRCDAQGNVTTEKFTAEETRTILGSMIENGIAGDQRDLLFTAEKLDGFAKAEFDWANSPYYFVRLVPDARYLILAQGYYDEAGTEPSSDLTVCHVSTATQPVVGDPQIEVDATEGYFGVSTVHFPNEDAPYFYYFAGDKNGALGCDTYIDLFGQRMWIDFIRHYYVGEPAARENDELNATWMMTAPAGTEFFWSAIPLDLNQVPNIAGYVQRDLIVKQLPTERPVAVQSIEPNMEHIGADVYWYDFKMNDGCPRLHYGIFTKEDGDKIAALEGEELENYKAWHIGVNYAVVNTNYRYDGTNHIILGTGIEGTGLDWDCRFDHVYSFSGIGSTMPGLSNMVPGTDYVLVSVGINPYMEYSDVHISKPFQMKEVVRDQPEKCATRIDLKLEKMNRDGLRFTFNYDYGKAAMVYFNWIGEGDDESGLTPESPREEWLKWMLDKRYAGEGGPNAIPWANIWAADQASGIDTYGLAGLQQDHTYRVAYCVTDLNGVVSEIKFAECNIPAVIGGYDPKTTISYDYTNGIYTFSIQSNEDMVNLKHGTFDSTRSAALLGYLHSGLQEYEDYIEAWTDVLLADGLSSNNTNYTFTTQGMADPSVILALPYGRDNKRGELQYLLYADGEFHTDLKAYLAKYAK